MQIVQTSSFKKSYKKLPAASQKAVDSILELIIEDPNIGVAKKGDLKGVFVYKFKINRQENLLAYQWDPKTRIFLALGVHENFYRNIKLI